MTKVTRRMYAPVALVVDDDPHAADTHGDAAHGDEHGIDFNKPPLPGLAPDLLTLAVLAAAGVVG